MTEHFFRHPRIRVGVIAQRPGIALAEETVTAGNSKGDDDTGADFFVFNTTADFDDLTHEFVTENVAMFHGGVVTIIQVQIGATNCGGGDFDNCVSGVENLRIGNGFDFNFVRTLPANCFHIFGWGG